MFKGERNLGKTTLAINTINHFLEENENNRAIYVGLSKNSSIKGFDQVLPKLRNRASFFTVSGEDTTISNAEYFLLPKVALQTAQSYLNDKSIKESKNLLFVFDDVLLHHFKERSIFDLANQPFAPINLCNEIMENTGMFCDKDTSMTSIFIVDKDSTSLMFKKDELNFCQHLESMTDQIVDFSSDRISLNKGMMPLIDMKPDNAIIDYWQSPLLKKVKGELQSLINQLRDSHTMHVLRKQMKMDEDPWDNYLIYDAKYFVPLLCHNTDIPIEQ